MTSQPHFPLTGRLTFGIETSTSLCSVALLGNSGECFQHSAPTDRRHAEILPDLIDRLLKDANAAMSDVGLISVSIGPGSFTGLRVGLSFAKGMAIGLKSPVSTVGSLEALATCFLQQHPELVADGVRLSPLIPARKAESFGQVFKFSSGKLIQLADPVLVGRPEADRLLEEGTILCGEGGTLLGLNESEHKGFIESVTASASVIAKLGLERWINQPESILPASELEPRYLKEFTVTPKKTNISKQGN